MQYNEFIEQVQRRAELDSEEAALGATRATFETLADHLAGNAPAKLAAELPEGIKELITDYKNDPDAEGEGFGTEEFVRRVAEKIGVDDTDAAQRQAVAVLAVLQDAVSPGEIEKVRVTLPADYNVLFEGGSSDILSARRS